MNKMDNPFVPGAGTMPPKLSGRDDLIERAEMTLHRVKKGRAEKSFIIVGLRGVGKTVTLNQVFLRAEKMGYMAVQFEAHENKSLAALLVPKLRSILLQLDKKEFAGEITKRALGALSGFMQSIRLQYKDVTLSFFADSELGLADSGDLETDLADLFEIIGKAAQEKKTAIVLIIDELQYIQKEEMSALIMAMHRISQRNLPIVLIGGGLPQVVAMAGQSKSYAERLFDYPEISALSYEEVEEATALPIREEHADISAAAIKLIYKFTQGYPYYIQQWGYTSWNVATGDVIEAEDVEKASDLAIQALDQSFFRVRFDRVTPKERDYMFAMADLGTGPHRSGDIAIKLGKRVDQVAPFRSSLIKKGMIFSPAHGDAAFTVPMFDEYLMRVKSNA